MQWLFFVATSSHRLQSFKIDNDIAVRIKVFDMS
jgi:hypothetical protein